MAGRIVSIFGTSQTKSGEPVYELAHDLGNRLAKAGFVIANGGYGGVMEASAKGASQSGGEVIGVTCSAFKRSGANEFVTREIQTECLEERLRKLVELGDAYVVLPGGTGTLLELADVWEHKNKGFAGYEKPIIIVGPFWQPLVDLMREIVPTSAEVVEQVHESKEAAELLMNRLT